MKRFIITVLFVSVFFIGIGSIIEKTSAKFNSDEKAMQLIRQARIAIGGDTNLNEVQSMSIVGTTSNYFEKNGIQDVKQGSLEINLEMPNRFSKMVKIGNPDNAGDEAEVHKEVNVVVMNKDGKVVDGNNKENVFVIKKGDGKDVEWETGNDENIKFDDGKVIIRKDDGTVEEIKTDGKQRVIIRKDADGNVLTEDVVGPKRIVVEKEDDSSGGVRQNEMLRTTIALLMTAPQGTNVTYKFLGEGNVDGNLTNIIGVESNGSSFKLHLDSATKLPRMISFAGQPHRVMFVRKDKMDNMPKEKMIEMKRDMANQAPVEHQIRFSDFRTVGNLIIPHRWSESAGDKQIQTTDITSIELNPPNIADKFGKENVFVRKIKSKSDN